MHGGVLGRLETDRLCHQFATFLFKIDQRKEKTSHSKLIIQILRTQVGSLAAQILMSTVLKSVGEGTDFSESD